MSRAQADVILERVWQRREGQKTNKKKLWILHGCFYQFSVENFREVLIGWDDAVILGIYQS